MTRNEFLLRLALAAVLTPVIKYAAPLIDVHPAWLLAAVAALLLVFLGEWIINAATD